MPVAQLPLALPPCSSCHEQNIDMDLPCLHDCDFAGCENKLQTHLAHVKESELLASEDGLFATQDIKKGTFVASFGRVQPVAEGLENDLGYSIPVTETGSGRVVFMTPRAGVGRKHKAHAINHSCSGFHVNVEYVHTRDIGPKAAILARTSKHVQAGDEFFACYGPKNQIRFFDSYPCLCHVCRLQV